MGNEKRIKEILVKLAEKVQEELDGSSIHICENFDITELIDLAKELKGKVTIDYELLTEYRN